MKDYSERLVTFSQVSPTFFIGLGGSGSDVVNRIAEKLKSRWNWHTLEELIHFFAIDTNTHDLSKQESIARENRLLISDFDKRAFVEQKRGDGYQNEDEYLTQWVHDWYQFRGTRGAGAGQIRIEARLALYYQLEQDRGRIMQRFTSAMNTARHHDNPYRKNEPPHFNVFVYGSIAGGTGSGSFIPVAYLLKELVEQQGWIPKVYGTLIMPSLFLNEVPGALHRDINANGYAALKELEHLMKLGAEGSLTEEEFHYNPNNPHEPDVVDKPYDFVYLADKPTTFEITEYKNAIADAAYLLLYSPILGAQASDYDNYEKHQKGLVSGYTVYYGSNGCSVLLLPDEDILHYCALRYAAKAMGDYLLFKKTSSDGADFSINFNDPKFQRLSRQAQAEEIDEKFLQFIEYEARRERDDEIENGPYQAVAELQTPTGSDLLTEFDAELEAFVAECTEAIDLPTVSATDIVEANIKIDQEVNDLRNEVNASRSRVRAAWDAARQEIKSGLAMRDFFSRHQANPYTQRAFLIRSKEKLRSQIDELAERIDGIQAEVDLSGDQVSDEVKNWRDRLNETAKLTMMERIKRKNEDFIHARSGFVQYFNGTLVDGNRALIVDDFKQQWLREYLDHIEKRLDSFRSVAMQAVDAISAVEKEAEDARQTGRFAHGEGRSNAFILDVEALQEVGGERLWDLYFEDRFVAEGREFNYFDEAAIFGIITDAFNPKIDDTGRRVARTSREITEAIRDGLVELGTERLRPEIVGTRKGGDDMTQKGLLLDDALFYEARYHFRRQYRADGSEQEPTSRQVESYIKSKFRFAENKSNPMATFDGVEDTRVINSTGTLVGCHDAYRERLEPLLDEVTPEGRRIPNWTDEKAIVFYQANLGIPLYFYRRVNTEMKRDYDLAMEKEPAERGYPIHIESSWEDDLPDLDPLEHRENARGASREKRLLSFAVGLATGVFREHDDGGVHWHLGKFDGPLGDDHFDAFESLDEVDERTRRRLESALDESLRALTRGTDPNLASQLDAYVDDVDELIWRLEQNNDPAEAGQLEFARELEEVVKTWRQTLG
jgi:hypothetical protein